MNFFPRFQEQSLSFVARFCSIRGFSPNSLYARLSPLGNPKLSLIPELDWWAESGRVVHIPELRRIIRDLRKHNRLLHAFQVSEWMLMRENCQVSAADRAVHLDLIGRVQGLNLAEKYFASVKETNEKIYGALLNCYVRERLTEKSLSHMLEMKELGLASGALPYNNIMCLYTYTNKYEQIPVLLNEMKECKVVPDNFSYRICMNAYGALSDMEGVERTVEEMERQPHIIMGWNDYTVMANVYMNAGLTDKAALALKKAEDLLLGLSKGGLHVGYNNLISLYGKFGSVQAVQRLWLHQKKACRMINNKDYITMLASLVKLKMLDEAESLFKEWEASGNCFDFRVPDVLLFGYCGNRMVDKAESFLEELLKKGRVPIPNTFAILASAFVEKGCMVKAFLYMKRAIASYPGNEGWKPKEIVLERLMEWLRDEKKIEDLEAFEKSLKGSVYMQSSRQ